MVSEQRERKIKLERLFHRIALPTNDGSISICITQEEKLGSRLAMQASLKDVVVTHDACEKEMRLERLSETQQWLNCSECNFAIRFSTDIRSVGELDREFSKR